MGKALWWILGGVAVVGGTAAVIIVNKKKKKKEEDAKKQDSNGGSSTKKTSNGVLYSGISSAQTKTLQQKLNAFIASGALGQVMELFGLGNLGTTYSYEYNFEESKTGDVAYQYRQVVDGKPKDWTKWSDYGWGATAGSYARTAHKAWEDAGKPVGVYFNEKGEAAISNPAATTAQEATQTPATGGSAIEVFKNSITNALTNGALVVDGAYGKNTMAVVSALQIYLNATKKSGLTVDGKYGPKTDAATGWGIC